MYMASNMITESNIVDPCGWESLIFGTEKLSILYPLQQRTAMPDPMTAKACPVHTTKDKVAGVTRMMAQNFQKN